MSKSPSILEALLQALPDLRPQIYFKSSLTALSHAMEDQVLAGSDRPLVIATFQRERFYRQEAHRYLRIAGKTGQVYVLAVPETDFANRSDLYEMVAFGNSDSLAQEWNLIVVGAQYASCLICRERPQVTASEDATGLLAADQSRRFEGIWTFNRKAVYTAATLLLNRILEFRPELASKIAEAQQIFLADDDSNFCAIDPGPFAERLVTYLQAGQYKLLKAYRAISAQERKERLVNSITAAVRQSLNPAEILNVAARELGQALGVCRCLIYRCKGQDTHVTIQHEYLGSSVASLLGQEWSLSQNSLFEAALARQGSVSLSDTHGDPWVLDDGQPLAANLLLSQQWQIASWLLAPVIHQNRVLGVIELHDCNSTPHRWTEDEQELVQTISNQIGVALIQAEAYANLEDLNQQLEALDRTRSNLIAITGHELRTPLSTIQVCLESLASEIDMLPEMQEVMLKTAMADAERMRKLIQDFLTLSQLESGRVTWNLEVLPLQECVELALSSIRARQSNEQLPTIDYHLSPGLMVEVDGEWLVELLSKLLDNACKFTGRDGKVSITTRLKNNTMVEVIIADTGRGIEPNRLEIIFDRFYQEEGALRRSAGGTGLGLAICRQIITGLGGQIWAESEGKDQGSAFHFTIPLVGASIQAPVMAAVEEPVTVAKKARRKVKAK